MHNDDEQEGAAYGNNLHIKGILPRVVDNQLGSKNITKQHANGRSCKESTHPGRLALLCLTVEISRDRPIDADEDLEKAS